jgi:hypothetical protein
MEKLLEGLKVVNGLAPAADRYNTNPTTDIVSLKSFQNALFLLSQVTAGTNTGTATVTIEACSDVSGTGAEAIAFDYYRNEAADTSDDFGAKTAATTAGFTTVANKTAIYAIEVKASDLPSGKPFVRAKLTEVVNDPVTGSVTILLGQGQQGNPDTLPTAIV